MFRIARLTEFMSVRQTLRMLCLLLYMLVATTNCAFSDAEVGVDEIVSEWSKSVAKQRNAEVKVSRVTLNHLQRTCAVQDAVFLCFDNEWNELRIQQSQLRAVPQKIRIDRGGKSEVYELEASRAEHWVRNSSKLKLINHLEKQVSVLNLKDKFLPSETVLSETVDEVFLLLRGPQDNSEIFSNWDVTLLSQTNFQSKLRLISRRTQRMFGRDIPNQQIDIFLKSTGGEVHLTGFNYEVGGITDRWNIISRETPTSNLASQIESTNRTIEGYRLIERSHEPQRAIKQ